jgi:hypothetical protein
MPPPVIRITVDGKLALTVEQAAARKGVGASSMRGEISRYQVQPVADLDGKKKLYSAKEIDAMWKARPGVGSPGKKRKPAASE